jgi:hypothetical protein
MIPGERRLVERLRNEPFALVGIISDGDRESLLAFMKEHGIVWPQVVDGDSDGSWTNRWNVRGWPTFFVLDPGGTIVWKGHDEAGLMAAVERAMASLRPQ